MFKRLKIIYLIFPLLFSCLTFVFAENITITTYYPSPYGSYNELTTTGNTYLATSSGYVGIGTTNPQKLLYIYGNLAVNALDRDSIGGYAAFDFRTAGTPLWGTGLTSGSNDYQIWDAAAGDLTRFYIAQTSGNVGIGSTSPSALLHVKGSSIENTAIFHASNYSPGSEDTTITIGGSAAGAGEKYVTYQDSDTGANAWMVGMDDDEQFKFDYGAAGEIDGNQLVLLQNGNVGIGITSPALLLDVNGNTVIRGTYSSDWVQSLALMRPDTSGYDYLYWHTGTGNPTVSTVKFALGLDAIEGSEDLWLLNQGMTGSILGRADAVMRVFKSNGYVNFNGFVGIGTSAPTVPLYVNTSASISLIASYGAIAASTWASRGAASRAVSIYAPNGTVAGNAIFSVSDQRLKENIAPLNPDMVDAFFSSVNPVSFRWIKDQSFDSGFIAQDLIRKGFEYLVSEIPDEAMAKQTNAEGIISPAGRRFVVNYNSIIPILAAGIQKNNLKIASLSSQIAPLSSILSVDGTKVLAITGSVGIGKTVPSVALDVVGGIASSGAAGIGYSTGSGGTVTQLTNKSTGVTLNKTCGQITMSDSALSPAEEVSFTVTNSTVAATDSVIVNIGSGATVNTYLVSVQAVSPGSFTIIVSNVSTTSRSEAIVLNFAVIKGVNS
jgi:hypothetical protein